MLLSLWPLLGVIALRSIAAEEDFIYPTHLKIGLAAPMDKSKLGFERCMAAANLGIEKAQSEGFLRGINIT
jgi:hypothetical protein